MHQICIERSHRTSKTDIKICVCKVMNCKKKSRCWFISQNKQTFVSKNRAYDFSYSSESVNIILIWNLLLWSTCWDFSPFEIFLHLFLISLSTRMFGVVKPVPETETETSSSSKEATLSQRHKRCFLFVDGSLITTAFHSVKLVVNTNTDEETLSWNVAEGEKKSVPFDRGLVSEVTQLLCRGTSYRVGSLCSHEHI